MPSFQYFAEESTLSDYKELVLPTLAPYANLVQTGIREGTDLRQHILNGVFFLGSVAGALGFSDAEQRLLMAAFTLHDANKMTGATSLKKVPLEELFVAHHLDSFTQGAVDLATIRLLVVNTSSRHAAASSLLFGGNSALQQRFVPMMVAADIHDLSDRFAEAEKKERLRKEVVAASGQSLYLVYHRVAEHFGAFSALVHTAAAQAARAHGAIPVWIYPEGTWYLSPTPTLAVETAEIAAAYLRERAGLVGGFEDLVEKTKDGFKLQAAALERWEDSYLVDAMEDLSRRQAAESVFLTLTKRIPNYAGVLPEGARWPARVDEVQPGRMWLAAENLLKAITGFKQKPTDFLIKQVAYTRPQILQAQLAPLYEQPYVLMASVPDPWAVARQAMAAACAEARRLTGAVVGQSRLTPEVERWLQGAVQWGGAAQAQPASASFSASLQCYLQGERSSLGAALGPVNKLLSREVLGETRVTQFSNSLRGGAGQPDRQRDAFQQEVLEVQVLATRMSGKSPPLFLHLFPDGISRNGWSAVAGGLTTTRDQGLVEGKEYACLHPRLLGDQLGWEWETLFCGAIPPERRALHGNGLTLPIAPPIDANEAVAFVDATILTTHLLLETGQRGVLSPFLAVLPPEGATRLRLEGVHPLLGRLLPDTFDGAGLRRLHQRLTALERLNSVLRRPGSKDDHRLILARAASTSLLRLLFVFDRLVVRRDLFARKGEFQSLFQLLFHLIPESLMSTPVSALLHQMAQVAAEASLKGSGWERNDLLRPLNETFKALRRARGTDDAELALAAAEDRIFTALDTISKRDGMNRGRKTRDATRAFIDLFRRLISDGYGGSIARLRADERLLRSAYITYLRAELDSSRADSTPSSQES